MPQPVALLRRQLVVRGMDRESRGAGGGYGHLLPLPHLLAAPAGHGVVVDREPPVGHHKILADADDASESLAPGARTVRIVEVEHQVGRLRKLPSAGLEPLGELEPSGLLCVVNRQRQCVVPLEESGLRRVGQTALLVGIGADRQAVDQQLPPLGRGGQRVGGGEHVGYLHRFAVMEHARVAPLEIDVELRGHRAPLGERQRGAHHQARSLGAAPRRADHVVDRMLRHPLAGGRIAGHPYAPHQQAQVFVDLRGGAYGAARIARADLLLYGYGRRQAAYEAGGGLGHAPQKLAGVGRERLHVAPLPLGIERIECERRLARAREPGDDGHAPARYLHVDAPEIVDAHPARRDIRLRRRRLGAALLCRSLHSLQSYEFPAGSRPCRRALLRPVCDY